MKKTLLSLSIVSAIIFSACSSKKEDTTREMVFLNDSLYRSSLNTDTAALVADEPEIEAPPVAAARPTVNKKPQRTPKKRYNNTVYNNPQPSPAPAVTPPTPAPVSTGTTPSSQPTTGTGTETASQPAEAEKAKKDGISKGAQGAIIGGIGGAAAGAIITRKGKGAVIGGVIGAAGGYILGRKKDRADGRVNQ